MAVRKVTVHKKTKAVAKKKPSQPINYISLVLDDSSSMSHLKDSVKKAYKNMVQTIKEESVKQKQKTYVSVVTFSDPYRINKSVPVLAEDLSDNLSNYYANGGSTALFDGVAAGAEAIDVINKDSNNISYLVVAFTDGQENNSRKFNKQTLKNFVNDKNCLGNWTFTLQVPPGQSSYVANNLGFDIENVREWETTVAGMRDAETHTSIGFTNYFGSRSKGLRSVSNFYNVTTDLSQVTSKDLKKNLDDISSQFKVIAVEKEEDVKEFIQRKTGKELVLGSVYYQLTKTEKVQPQKSLLIMEKGKKAIYGGTQARDLIGLPHGAHAKVTPGNNANYDIFAQSTSVNRKLVRGTRILLDIQKTKHSTPTWGSVN